MKIKCIIIDDESIAREGIKKYVQRVDLLELCGIFKSAFDAHDFLEEQEVDLLFLDIEMPVLSGMSFLKTLKQQPAVIFTTAYPRYAMQSFDFNVIDYLLKPISFDRFMKAVNKATQVLTELPNKEAECLFLKQGQSLIKVVPSEIEYIEAMQNYIKICMGQEVVIILMTLKDILGQLSSDYFLQTHRSFIVNIRKVVKYADGELLLPSSSIAVSSRLRALVVQRLQEYTGKKEE